MSSERRIQSEILMAAAANGMTLFRNNVGQGWTGKAERLADGSVLIREPRPLHAGLCKGSSDLIGLRPLVVTDSMVGETLAQFVAVEVKSKRGRVTADQQRFLTFVHDAGGMDVVARCAGDLAASDKTGERS